MDVALTLIAVAVLTVLMIISLIKLLRDRETRKQAEARAFSSAAQEQHDDSLARRAAVRARHAEKVEAEERS
jgi:heme exporter protein D